MQTFQMLSDQFRHNSDASDHPRSDTQKACQTFKKTGLTIQPWACNIPKWSRDHPRGPPNTQTDTQPPALHDHCWRWQWPLCMGAHSCARSRQALCSLSTELTCSWVVSKGKSNLSDFMPWHHKRWPTHSRLAFCFGGIGACSV